MIVINRHLWRCTIENAWSVSKPLFFLPAWSALIPVFCHLSREPPFTGSLYLTNSTLSPLLVVDLFLLMSALYFFYIEDNQPIL